MKTLGQIASSDPNFISRAEIALAAGFCLGLAVSTRFDLSDDERDILRKAALALRAMAKSLPEASP